MARRHLLPFLLYNYRRDKDGNSLYKPGWFHKLLCQKLEQFYLDVEAGLSPRLLISVPPRIGKSEIVTVNFPAWVFGKNPNFQYISASADSNLASEFSSRVQNLMEDRKYQNVFPDTCLYIREPWVIPKRSGKKQEMFFNIVNTDGCYKAAGVMNNISGYGANILNIDDPIKDRLTANSAVYRQRVWDWFASAALNRLLPGGGVILTMTRWHEDDLTGRILAKEAAGGRKWDKLFFPAIALEDEAYRKKGEALHPDRYPVSYYETEIKPMIGAYEWAALYDQSPRAPDGNIFKHQWFNYYYPATLPQKFSKIIASWDMSFKDTDGSDFVVGQIWGRAGANIFLLDQVRGRWDFTESVKEVIRLKSKWPKARQIYIEDKANGPAIISTLKSRIQGIVPVTPEGSKQARASAVSYLFEAGNVFFPNPDYDLRRNSWLFGFEDEITTFPFGAHDDQVDAMTQALLQLEQKRYSKSWENVL